MVDDADTRNMRFDEVFVHYEAVAQFADRRGSRDPESIAAETMSIAWRRLDIIDTKSCLPWLLTTARILLKAEFRKLRDELVGEASMEIPDESNSEHFKDSLDPEIDQALSALDPIDREAILLIAWDELTPKEAAETLGIKPTAFRVRLHRARRRFVSQFKTANGAATNPKPMQERA